MAKIKKISLPGGSVYNIADYMIAAITGANAGQVLKVSSVDTNGVPESLTVGNADSAYSLSCQNGVLSLSNENEVVSQVSFSLLGADTVSLITVSDDDNGNVQMAFHTVNEE